MSGGAALSGFVMAFTMAFSAPLAARAHGPVAQQAAKAVELSTKLFLSGEPAANHDLFESLVVTKVGDERFLVRIALKGRKETPTYACGLDETAKPVKWGCTPSK